MGNKKFHQGNFSFLKKKSPFLRRIPHFCPLVKKARMRLSVRQVSVRSARFAGRPRQSSDRPYGAAGG
jgi:hypothetical protein